jgi:hypothetical protein
MSGHPFRRIDAYAEAVLPPSREISQRGTAVTGVRGPVHHREGLRFEA